MRQFQQSSKDLAQLLERHLQLKTPEMQLVDMHAGIVNVKARAPDHG